MLTPPLKYHGGKHYHAKWIISYFAPHAHYVEPFFGGGSVLLQKEPTASEVVNDIDGVLTLFWEVLASPHLFERLRQQLEATPFSEPLFNQCLARIRNYRIEPATLVQDDPVEVAFNFFVVARQSRQGVMKEFSTLSRVPYSEALIKEGQEFTEESFDVCSITGKGGTCGA